MRFSKLDRERERERKKIKSEQERGDKEKKGCKYWKQQFSKK